MTSKGPGHNRMYWQGTRPRKTLVYRTWEKSWGKRLQTINIVEHSQDTLLPISDKEMLAYTTAFHGFKKTMLMSLIFRTRTVMMVLLRVLAWILEMIILAMMAVLSFSRGRRKMMVVVTMEKGRMNSRMLQLLRSAG